MIKKHGFPKAARLTKRPSYLGMNHNSRRLHTKDLIILWKENTCSKSRLGITVTRKVANAVGRNRVKRLVKEVFRQSNQCLPKGVDIVIIAKRSAKGISFQQVSWQMRRAFGEISSARAS